MTSSTDKEVAKAIGENIPESAWEVLEYDPMGVWRKDRAFVPDPTGQDRKVSVVRKVNLHETALLHANQQEYDDGQKMVRNNGTALDAKVASIPENIFFRDIVPHLKEGDTEHFKWWIKQDENKKYKTQKGDL
tara:strand:+ start:1532 stop:1930 length:399 start_codon:yes stop_codon:yes gene_type:complete